LVTTDTGAAFLKNRYLSLKKVQMLSPKTFFRGNFLLDGQRTEFQAFLCKYCLIEGQPPFASSSSCALLFCFLPAEQLRFSTQGE